jgi:signal transduction histidine kinase
MQIVVTWAASRTADPASTRRHYHAFSSRSSPPKEIGQGTGLGLALVYAIVTDAGGAIDVKRAPGQGAPFAIYGPLVEVALAAADDTAAAAP